VLVVETALVQKNESSVQPSITGPGPTALGQIGKYGQMRKAYLQNHKRGLYSALLLSGKLMEHLADTEERASQMLETIMSQMLEKLEKNPPPDKGTDQMGWVRHMNMTRAMAESTVIREIVYE
jgi:ATP-dependent DNA ligase